jgi:macrolide transport system ATP-binding/permease protein
MDLITLEDVRKTYHLGEMDVPVLKGVSASIGCGEMVALTGPSGCGKSTLMNILGCLDRPTSGSYRLDGVEVSDLTPERRAVLRGQKIGFVFQNFNLLPRTTALDQVLMPLAYAQPRRSGAEGRKRAKSLLDLVGLSSRMDHHPSQLSGGQQQRVAIARALINNPPLLLADEPTGNLDSKTSVEILDMFKKLNAEEGLTVLLVTHDRGVAATAQRAITMRDGLIGAGAYAPQLKRRWRDPESSPHVERGSLPRPPAPNTRPAMNPMNILPAGIRVALLALRRNILRSALTTLGIVIGVGAVIAMVEIGQGSKQAVAESIQSLGANNLLIMPGQAASGGVSFGGGTSASLTPADVEAIAREVPSAIAVAPVVRARTQVIAGSKNWVPLYIYGTSPEFLTIRDWPVTDGRAFTSQELAASSEVCLIGTTVQRELFDDGEAVGQTVRVNGVPMRVVGVLARKGANTLGADQDDIILSPWRTIKFKVSGQSAQTANQSATTAAAAGTPASSASMRYPSQQPSPYPAQSATETADHPPPPPPTYVDQILVRVNTEADVKPSIDQITACSGCSTGSGPASRKTSRSATRRKSREPRRPRAS